LADRARRRAQYEFRQSNSATALLLRELADSLEDDDAFDHTV
jgi:hypothetical protein